MSMSNISYNSHFPTQEEFVFNKCQILKFFQLFHIKLSLFTQIREKEHNIEFNNPILMCLPLSSSFCFLLFCLIIKNGRD